MHPLLECLRDVLDDLVEFDVLHELRLRGLVDEQAPSPDGSYVLEEG